MPCRRLGTKSIHAVRGKGGIKSLLDDVSSYWNAPHGKEEEDEMRDVEYKIEIY